MGDDLFIFAGEKSGDEHGAKILRALKHYYPSISVCGVAGPLMRQEGAKTVMPMENFQVMGFTDVFKALPRLVIYFKKILAYILKNQPKAVLFIDYPGFNLRMAKALRKKGFKNKLVHYICPTVWAHGKGRIKTLSNTLDLLLSIFPFEKKYFKNTSLKPVYVGHPLLEKAGAHPFQKDWKEHLPLKNKEELVGIFPGSRTQEITQNFPKILEACVLFKKKHPSSSFIVSYAQEKLVPLIEGMIKETSLILNDDICLVKGKENFHIMQHIKSSIATSGTITFELGTMSVPTVSVYHLTPLNAFIAQHLIKLSLPYYCIVNIICQKHIFPELYHLSFTPDNVAEALANITEEGYWRQNALEGCQEMLDKMSHTSLPSHQIAKEVGELIYDKQPV